MRMLATDVRDLHQGGELRRGEKEFMPDQNDDRNTNRSDDEVLKALDELEAALRENAENERLLAKRIADVRQARENGQEWKAILGDEDEPGHRPAGRARSCAASPRRAATCAARWWWRCGPRGRASRASPTSSV